MNQLVGAYQNNDISEFERILEANREAIMADPFIREHIEELLTNIRSQVNFSKLSNCISYIVLQDFTNLLKEDCTFTISQDTVIKIASHQSQFCKNRPKITGLKITGKILGKKPVNLQVLLKLCKPYSRIKLSYLVESLRISQEDVVAILKELILDKQLSAKIDEIEQVVIAVSKDATAR